MDFSRTVISSSLSVQGDTWLGLKTAQEKEYHSSTVFARVSPIDPFPKEESLQAVHRLAEA
jgi:hypothetical protein